LLKFDISQSIKYWIDKLLVWLAFSLIEMADSNEEIALKAQHAPQSF
jgi:hypothetical protein